MSRLRIFSLVLGICSIVATVHAAILLKIPDDLLYQRIPLPAEENAYVEWLQVEKELVPASDEVNKILSLKSTEPAQVALVEKWIQTNATAFNLLESSLKKDKAQAPRYNPEEIPPFLTCSRKVSAARLFLAHQAAARGDHHIATSLFLGTLRLSKMLRDADGPAIHYLVARAIRSNTEKALIKWAHGLVRQTDAPLLRAMLEQLPELDDEIPAYERMLRVEFTEAISPSLRMENILKRVEEARTNEMLLSFQPEELQRAYLLVHDPRLLPLHPNPYDHRATQKAVADTFRQYQAMVKSRWSDDLTALFLDKSDSIQEQYLADLQPLLKATARERLPLTRAAAKRAAKHYAKVTNPVGRYQLATPDTLYRTAVVVFQTRTERNVARTLLALRLFELEHGRPAKTLEELVEAKILPALPIDYFANAPLRYSPAKKILWSIGENGVDDGGVGKESQWMEQDAVWVVPPISF